MPILSLIAKLGLDKTGFDAGMTAAGKSVNKFGTGLKNQLAGAFSAAVLVQAARASIQYADALDELSERLGITARQAQLYSLAAKLGGADSEFFAVKFEKLRKAMGDGKNPLAMFGISAGDPVEAIAALAEKIQTTGLNAEQANKFVEIFGKGSGKLINVLGDLKQAGEGTLFFGEEGIADAKRLSDFWIKAGNNALVFFNRIGEGLKTAGQTAWWLLTGDADAIRATPEKTKTPLDEEGFEQAEERSKEMAAVQEKLAAQLEKNRVAQMTDEERLNDLMEQRLQLVKELGFALTKEAEAAIQLKIAQNAGEIIAAQGRVKVPSEKARKGFTIEESALGRIGAFTGESAKAGLGNQQMMQLEKLTKIHEALVSKGIIVKDVR